jgi:hypothetical protein
MKAILLVAAALTGCTVIEESFQTNGFSGDPFPIGVDTSTGAVMIGMHDSDDAEGDNLATIVDVLAPITVVDPGQGVEPEITFPDLDVLGTDPTTNAPTLPRAKFTEAQVVAVHPCADADPDNPGPCRVGSATSTVAYQAVLSADTLAGDAVRLDLAYDQMKILPDVAGDERHRTFACDAVFIDPYFGGGTLVIGGTELEFDGRRVTLQACLSPDPDQSKPQSQRGTDALFVLSTGVGISIIGEAAYARYRETHPAAPDASTLPVSTVTLASGPVTGHVAQIPSLALVANTSAAQRAPCRQVYGHHLLAQRDCTETDDCPCEDGTTLCGIPAIVETKPSVPLDVLVIGDDDATLVALRTELRPDQPQVDGILGTEAIRALELDIDYPNDRVLARCNGAKATCQIRPELYQEADRDHINECMDTPTIALP